MPDKDGLIRLPEAPGLGMKVNPPYAQALSCAMSKSPSPGKLLFRSASLRRRPECTAGQHGGA